MIIAAMSLSVALCARMPDEVSKINCLRDTFSEAVTASNNERLNARKRLGEPRAQALLWEEGAWLKSMSETCKVPLGKDGFVDTTPDTTDFACLIDTTATPRCAFAWHLPINGLAD
jgi:hypothetical protein